jgi:oligopeptide/dipeptide ABC transporter ATP-binding protein
MSDTPLLSIRGLRTWFYTESGVAKAVDGIDLDIESGEVLGLVGESGSGKSVTALSILRLIPDPPGRIAAGQIFYNGRDLLTLSWDEIRAIRGSGISMVFQEPMTSLNPVFTIGMQVTEVILAHEPVSHEEAHRRAVEILTEVGIADADARMKQYPHHLSGGQRQRVMIAMALVLNPSLLIADEPTTALDVTIQAQILELLDRLRADFDSSVILITHDLGVVAEVADEILVMYAGRIVERGSKRNIFYDPQHPYAWGLLGSIPRLDRPKPEKLHSIEGTPPSLINLPQGCKFRPRCPHAFEKCFEEPELKNRVEDSGHLDRCWLSVDDKRNVRDTTISGEQRVVA